MLSRSKLHKLFTYDDGKLFWRKSLRKGMAGKRAGTTNGGGYRQVTIDGTIYAEHRVIYMMHHGKVPNILDHINGDRADNRVENLRPCSQQQNCYNTSGWAKKVTPKGVTWNAKDKRWQAQLSVNGKNTYLGQFKTAEEAAARVSEVRSKSHGAFAKGGL